MAKVSIVTSRDVPDEDLEIYYKNLVEFGHVPQAVVRRLRETGLAVWHTPSPPTGPATTTYRIVQEGAQVDEAVNEST